MKKQIFKEIYIFTKSGIPILNVADNLDPMIFVGFLSVIKELTSKITEEGIKSFIIDKNKYIYLESYEGEVYFVFKLSVETDFDLIKNFSFNIVQMFSNQYSANDIEKWKGKISFFSDFRKKLEKFVS